MRMWCVCSQILMLLPLCKKMYLCNYFQVFFFLTISPQYFRYYVKTRHLWVFSARFSSFSSKVQCLWAKWKLCCCLEWHWPVLYPVLTFQSTPLATWVISQKQYFLELMLYNINSYCFALNKFADFVDT